jgi:hypothetical protein
MEIKNENMRVTEKKIEIKNENATKNVKAIGNDKYGFSKKVI